MYDHTWHWKFRSMEDKYLGPNEPEAGPVDSFDDNVQKFEGQVPWSE